MVWTLVVNWLSQHGGRILLIIILSLVLYFLLRHFVPVIVKRTMSQRMKGRPELTIQKRADTLNTVFIDTGIVVIIIVSSFTILSEVGINITPAIAGLGIAGIAIGFGAQNLVKDIFNGILILLENQYAVGDWIQVAGVDGLVEELTLRRTVLRDFDGTVHNVPNGRIGIASNYTKEWARVNMNISVGYGEDLAHVIEVINRVGAEIAAEPGWAPLILRAPQVLRVEAFEDSGIAIKILGETRQMQQWGVMGELRLRLKKVFDEEGIEIPWPHTKVYFGNVPDDTGARKFLESSLPTIPPVPLPGKYEDEEVLLSEEGGEGG